MADITAGSLAGSLPRIRLFHRRCTLAKDLAARGIPTIPKKMVRQHKRLAIRERRPGWLRITASSANVAESVLDIFTVTGALDRLERATFIFVPGWIALLVCVASFLSPIFGIAAFFVMDWAWYYNLLFMIPLFAFLLGGGLDHFTSTKAMHDARQRWEWREPCLVGGELPEGWLRMPDRIRHRAEVVRTIPNTKIAAHGIDLDPIAAAIRVRRFRREIVYFGAWETGNPTLDTF